MSSEPDHTHAAEPRAPRRLTEHWTLLALILFTVSVALVVQGFAHLEIGRASTTSADQSDVVPQMRDAGPILDLSGRDVRSIAPPARTIALTFDDGPDPRWTPKILDVLARYRVPATFFVIGSRVADHAGLVRREVAGGHELGNHTFTHADLTRVPQWRSRLELRLTEVALAAATGRHSVLLRPPYSSVADAAASDTVRAWQDASRQGYVIVVSTLDAKDWQPDATAAEVERRATPPGTAGGIVDMHDGGGDRAATVAALDRLIPALLARGYHFVTVGDMAGMDESVVMPHAGTVERWQSRTLPVALRVGEWLAALFTITAIVVAVLALLRLLIVVVLAGRHARRAPPFDAAFAPPVSVLVPAYNESAGIEAAVRSVCTQDYTDFEVIVIDDGSTDDTAAIVEALVDEFGPARCSLLRQENRGKSVALNNGVRSARGEVIVTVDADTVFTRGALARLVGPFARAEVGAVSGNTKVANRYRLLGRWQHLEYVQGFNLDRRMYDVLGCMPTVPGAIGAFRASALHAVGGFSEDTLAEDTDITMALHRGGWDVGYEPRAIAYTEAPGSLRDLWRQRYRWSYGTMQSAWKHRHAVVERGPSHRLGWIGLPYLVLFQIVLPLLGPFVDLFAVYGLLFLDRKVVLAFWLGFMAIQLATTAYALHLDRESYRDLWAAPAQQFVYRQLMYLVVMQALFTAASGVRTGWHKLRRAGVSRDPSATPVSP